MKVVVFLCLVAAAAGAAVPQPKYEAVHYLPPSSSRPTHLTPRDANVGKEVKASPAEELLEQLIAALEELFANIEEMTQQQIQEALENIDLLLQELIILGGDAYAAVEKWAEENWEDLPEWLQNVLQGLGIGPGKRINALTLKNAQKVIGDIILIQIIQAIQMIIEYGAEATDAIISVLKNLILTLQAIGGEAWEAAKAVLEEAYEDLKEIMGDFLNDIGIGNGNKGLGDILIGELKRLIGLVIQAGEEASDEMIELLESLILQLQAIGGEVWEQVKALLEENYEELKDIIGDFLNDIGIGNGNKGLGDILIEELKRLIGLVIQAGEEASDEIIELLESLILQLQAIGGEVWEQVKALLEENYEELKDIIGDFLNDIGIGNGNKGLGDILIEELKRLIGLVIQAGQEASDEIVELLKSVILQLQAIGGEIWEQVKALLEENYEELKDIIGDFLHEIGIGKSQDNKIYRRPAFPHHATSLRFRG